MAEPTEELEPLFDYSRVQPYNMVFLDDDELDETPFPPPKRKKISKSNVDNVEDDVKEIQILECKKKTEDEDWLPPPPKFTCDPKNQAEDSILKELRSKTQELASFPKSADEVLRAVEESVKREHTSMQSSLEAVADQPSKLNSERDKIIISIQDKEGPKQFRIFLDDKFERLFKLYAARAKLDMQNLVFTFDGERVGPQETPLALGMEDDDIIEVHVKPQ